MTIFLAYAIALLFAFLGVAFIGYTIVKSDTLDGSKMLAGLILGIGFLLAAYAFSRTAGL